MREVWLHVLALFRQTHQHHLGSHRHGEEGRHRTATVVALMVAEQGHLQSESVDLVLVVDLLNVLLDDLGRTILWHHHHSHPAPPSKPVSRGRGPDHSLVLAWLPRGPWQKRKMRRGVCGREEEEGLESRSQIRRRQSIYYYLRLLLY
jgi:hypothetical protein